MQLRKFGTNSNYQTEELTYNPILLNEEIKVSIRNS